VRNVLCVGWFTTATSWVVGGLSCIPYIGYLIAPSASFGGTYLTLKYVLNKLETAAMEVVSYAAEHAGIHRDNDDDDDE